MKAHSVFQNPLILIFCCTLFLAGCATSQSSPRTASDPRWNDPRLFEAGAYVEMTFNALRNKDIKIPVISLRDTVSTPQPASKYYISSGLRDLSDEDLEFLEFAKYVENSIKALPVTIQQTPYRYNLIRTKDKDSADFLFTLAYGIGDPSTMTQTRTTSLGYSYAVGWMWFNVPPKTQTTATTTYTRNIIMEVYDLKSPKIPMVTKITIKSVGSTGDLRQVFPYMISGAMPQSLEGTDLQRSISVQARSPRILPILYGY